MKKINILILILISLITCNTSCSSNKNNKEDNEKDSIAIADSIARADSIAKANNIAIGMSVKEALQKPGVKKDVLMDMEDINGLGAYREYDTLILKQKGKKFLTNVTILWLGVSYKCENLKFEKLPDTFEGDITIIGPEDCAKSAKVIKEIK